MPGRNLYQSNFQRYHNGIRVKNPTNGRVEVYYVGIIDILIQYATRKKAEHFLKAIAYVGVCHVNNQTTHVD